MFCLPLRYLNACRIVSDIFSCSMPCLSIVLRTFLRINQRFHSIIEQWIRFCKIHNVKGVLLVFPCIWNPKVVPLGEVSGASMILFQCHFVRILRYLDYFLEIPTFKAAFKDQCLVFLILYSIIRLEAFVIAIDWALKLRLALLLGLHLESKRFDALVIWIFC